jgi:hypothetical protein
MLVSIKYDAEGNITSLTSRPREGTAACAHISEGQYCAEFDIPTIPDDLDLRQIFGRLFKLAEEFRVDLDTSQPRLVLRVAE